MEKHKSQTNWILDAALFTGFLASFWLELTGVALHQWLGVALAAGAAYHLLAHWNWVTAVTQRFFGRTSGQARLYYIIDAGIAGGLFLIMATGLVISTWLGLELDNYQAWRQAHVLVSVVTLLLVVLKIGLHWRWIIATARKYFTAPAALPATPQGRPGNVSQARLAAAPSPLGRREFLKLMGVVGAAACLSMVGVLKSDEQAKANNSAGQEQPGLAQGVTTSSTASSTCFVRCNRGCSYPGHCRRYVDTNRNNRCDLGECS